ncbi:hypothetical protein G6O69_30575 [Pseudenhygromyxa sp. WMMC2535]|uniref:winged helix-turn-helix domain-containing protein n=1 Tax=Pseudenhygromyxa sp. WMMC2535 TaxID=2712867 RepID=UPI0015568063|nr:winged helix-turn-helix domain-containing protein [Pseudenhygromyxa sp. WMMC2535]NVB42208.1 hypothetical protein [Pseudenhygromyxa sp. WMMC2535]
MTFLEAAIEVLRDADGPLHYKEIARLAVDQKLLSHVGRDPEAAMQTCLNQAVRSKVHDGAVTRSKPGHYCIRAGAKLPDPPEPPAAPEPLPLPAEDKSSDTRGRKKKSSNSKKKASKSSKKDEPAGGKKRTRRRKKAEPSEEEETPDEQVEASSEEDSGEEAAEETATTAEPEAETETETETETSSERAAEAAAAATLDVTAGPPIPMPTLDPSKVRFHGPEGSGLEGETDIALVMANAMSRLVDERPELREELDAMQKGQAPVPEVIEVGRKRRRDSDRNDRSDRDRGEDERGGRRRRRRRRKSRRVDWSEGAAVSASRGQELLDQVATVLLEAGPRSLHVRQIAESLASQNVLGGEISEIERAVTAALLLDVHVRGEASRFAIRGDARYQLRGARLPEKAAAAEYAARRAVEQLEKETHGQLLSWLQTLGARSLESLVRVWLDRESYPLVATLPPARGLGKLIVEDAEGDSDDSRLLVLIVPRKTSLEPKLWEGDAERNGCGAIMVFAMCDPSADAGTGDARVIYAQEFARWLLDNGVGVKTVTFSVPVLDADIIESVGGLDT